LSETVAYAVMSAPACVSALKIVVLPAFGSPTMPTSSASGVLVPLQATHAGFRPAITLRDPEHRRRYLKGH
jgi:hypothetical protein